MRICALSCVLLNLSQFVYHLFCVIYFVYLFSVHLLGLICFSTCKDIQMSHQIYFANIAFWALKTLKYNLS